MVNIPKALNKNYSRVVIIPKNVCLMLVLIHSQMREHKTFWKTDQAQHQSMLRRFLVLLSRPAPKHVRQAVHHLRAPSLLEASVVMAWVLQRVFLSYIFVVFLVFILYLTSNLWVFLMIFDFALTTGSFYPI